MMSECGDIYGNIVSYEGKNRKMASTENTGSDNQQGQNENSQNEENLKKSSGKVLDFLKSISPLLAIVVGGIFPGIIWVISTLSEHNADINYIKEDFAHIYEDINEIDEKYDSLNSNIEKLAASVDDNREISIQLESLIQNESAYKIVFQDTYKIKIETIKNEEYLAQPSWKSEDIIASDVEGDIIYKAEDLYNVPILTSYMEGNNEIYFYGRFNESNHWNGKCILNVYNEDKLVSIFEGIYDDGMLFSYKRIVEGKDSNWILNDRKRQGNYNSGETWTFEKTEDFIKGFNVESVKEKQILTIRKFLTSKSERLLSYYKGNTSNNLYNDTTGNAQYVKYKDNGDVDFLYVGDVVNGKLTDKSGKAWCISWGNAEDGYYFYQGQIINGHHQGTSKDLHLMTPDVISDKVNPEYFNCPLTGLIDSNI